MKMSFDFILEEPDYCNQCGGAKGNGFTIKGKIGRDLTPCSCIEVKALKNSDINTEAIELYSNCSHCGGEIIQSSGDYNTCPDCKSTFDDCQLEWRSE